MEKEGSLLNHNTTIFNDIRNLTKNEISSEHTDLFFLLMQYVETIEYIICFLVNALTIASVVKFDYLHKKSTNLLILSLSIADGLLGKYILSIQYEQVKSIPKLINCI